MAGNDKIETELAEIKALLKRAQRRADIQWVYSIGFVAMFGSLALLAVKAPNWQVLLTFLPRVAPMKAPPYFVKK